MFYCIFCIVSTTTTTTATTTTTTAATTATATATGKKRTIEKAIIDSPAHYLLPLNIQDPIAKRPVVGLRPPSTTTFPAPRPRGEDDGLTLGGAGAAAGWHSCT